MYNEAFRLTKTCRIYYFPCGRKTFKSFTHFKGYLWVIRRDKCSFVIRNLHTIRSVTEGLYLPLYVDTIDLGFIFSLILLHVIITKCYIDNVTAC